MMIELTEKELKEINKYSKGNLKNKLQLAIERGEDEKVDAYLKYIKDNKLDTLNNLNVSDYTYGCIVHSMLKRYQSIFKDEDKNSTYFSSREIKVDFSLLNKLIDAGLDLNRQFIFNDKKLDVIDILFNFDHKNSNSNKFKILYTEMLSYIEFKEEDAYRYIKTCKENSFKDVKKKESYSYYNNTLINLIFENYLEQNIKLEIKKDTLNSLVSSKSNGVTIRPKNVFNLIQYYMKTHSKDEINDNIYPIASSLLGYNEIKSSDIINLFDSHNIDFNESMNIKISPFFSSGNNTLPVLAVIIKNGSGFYDHWKVNEKVKELVEHYNFQFKDTKFIDIFKKDYYMSGIYYHKHITDTFLYLISKGVDFYGENENNEGIFHLAIKEESTSKFFMEEYFEKKGWDKNYLSKSGKNILDIWLDVKEKSMKEDGGNYFSVGNNDYYLSVFSDSEDEIDKKMIDSIVKNKSNIFTVGLFNRLKNKMDENYKDTSGNCIDLIPYTFAYNKYSPSSNANEGSISKEVNDNNENAMHLLIKNKTYEAENKIKFIAESIKSGLSVEDKDNDGMNPLQYLSPELWTGGVKPADIEDIKTIINSIQNVESLSLEGKDGVPVFKSLRGCVKTNERELFDILIERKMLTSVADIQNPPEIKKQKRI